MTRTEYLAQLDKYLKKLPRHDYQEAMDYFVEYFDEAGPENESQVIAELGSPREAAHEIMVNLLDKIIEEYEPKNTKNVIQIAILSILAAPLAIPLALVVAILVFVFFFLIGVFAFVLAIGSFAFFVFGISSIWDSLTISLGVSIPSFLLTIGISLLGFGLSAFCALGVSPLIQFTKNNFIKLAKRLSKKGARHA